MGLAEKIIYSEAVLVALGVLALTQSRGAWIALGGGVTNSHYPELALGMGDVSAIWSSWRW